MSKYEQIKCLSPASFRRLTGVHRQTFERMLTTYKRRRQETKKISGRPSTLEEADHLLMMLEYNREYRTYFHIAKSYGLSESTAYKIIKRVEDLLITSGDFSLPKKSVLYDKESPISAVAVDATESPIQRPKKNKDNGIPANDIITTSKHKS